MRPGNDLAVHATAALGLLTGPATGCTREAPAAPTDLAVVVYSDHAPASLSRVRVAAEWSDGTRRGHDVADDELVFPLSFGVVPLDTSAPGAVLISASAYDRAGALLNQTRARASFLRGETRLVELFLAERCRPVYDLCQEDEACQGCGVCAPLLDDWARVTDPDDLRLTNKQAQCDVPPHMDAGPDADAGGDATPAQPGMPEGGMDGGPDGAGPDAEAGPPACTPSVFGSALFGESCLG